MLTKSVHVQMKEHTVSGTFGCGVGGNPRNKTHKNNKNTEESKCNLFTHEAPKISRNSFKGVRAFQVELEFRNVAGFCGGRKTGVLGEKHSGQGREPTTNSTHI